MNAKVIETVVFKLAENVSEEAFINTTEAVSIFLKQSPGFISRRLSKSEDGTWLEHIEWASLEEAKAASKDFMSQQSLMPYMQSIDPESVVMTHQDLALSA
ncbi:MAG: hypothetical protein R3261_13965 [Alphaproteobacteria bacterium]|nr:hypothetical protein [Alphaproteobacteria bacterium]